MFITFLRNICLYVQKVLYICALIRIVKQMKCINSSKRKRIVQSTRKRIDKAVESVDAEVIDSKDVAITVPFGSAVRSVQDANLRKEQNLLRKQLSTYLQADFGKFVTCMNAITDPQLFATLYLGNMKLFLPRPKEFEGNSEEYENMIVSRLFGNKDK